jgi:hypothetical protein
VLRCTSSAAIIFSFLFTLDCLFVGHSNGILEAGTVPIAAAGTAHPIAKPSEPPIKEAQMKTIATARKALRQRRSPLRTVDVASRDGLPHTRDNPLLGSPARVRLSDFLNEEAPGPTVWIEWTGIAIVGVGSVGIGIRSALAMKAHRQG